MPTRPVSGSTAILLWLPPIAWAGVLFALSAGSGPSFDPPFPHVDKLEHVLAYGVLGFFLARAVAGSLTVSMHAAVIAGGMAAGLYGVSDEFHQSFTPGRMVEVADGVADTVGGFAGAGVFAAISRRREAARG